MAEQKGNVNKENKGKKGDNLQRVLVFEVGKAPKEVYINNTLEAKQHIVGGWIEQFPLFQVVSDTLYLICDEEGKLKQHCQPNCALLSKEDGHLLDIIHGTFFIVGDGDEDYRSLTDREVEMIKRAYTKTIVPVMA